MPGRVSFCDDGSMIGNTLRSALRVRTTFRHGMPTTDLRMNLPPEAVWATITDVNAWPSWGPTVSGARVDGGVELATGTTGTITTIAGVPLPFEIPSSWISGRGPGRWRGCGRHDTRSYRSRAAVSSVSGPRSGRWRIYRCWPSRCRASNGSRREETADSGADGRRADEDPHPFPGTCGSRQGDVFAQDSIGWPPDEPYPGSRSLCPRTQGGHLGIIDHHSELVVACPSAVAGRAGMSRAHPCARNSRRSSADCSAGSAVCQTMCPSQRTTTAPPRVRP